MAKIKIVTTPNIHKDVGKLDHLYIITGAVEEYHHSGKQFGIVFRNLTCNYHKTQQLHNWAFIVQKWKLMFTQNLHTNVDGSFICDSQKVEINQMSFSSKQLNKLWYIPTMECYLTVKRN